MTLERQLKRQNRITRLLGVIYNDLDNPPLNKFPSLQELMLNGDCVPVLGRAGNDYYTVFDFTRKMADTSVDEYYKEGQKILNEIYLFDDAYRC